MDFPVSGSVYVVKGFFVGGIWSSSSKAICCGLVLATGDALIKALKSNKATTGSRVILMKSKRVYQRRGEGMSTEKMAVKVEQA